MGFDHPGIIINRPVAFRFTEPGGKNNDRFLVYPSNGIIQPGCEFVVKFVLSPIIDENNNELGPELFDHRNMAFQIATVAVPPYDADYIVKTDDNEANMAERIKEVVG